MATTSAVPENPGTPDPDTTRKKTPSARSKARRRAVEILFEAQQRGVNPVEVALDTQQRLGFTLHPHTLALVRGVHEHQQQVDAQISAHSRDWALDRMPAVDRAIVAVGTYELLGHTWQGSAPDGSDPEQHEPPQQIPAAGVVISEAVALAALLSTDASPAFVNGVLDAIARDAGQS